MIFSLTFHLIVLPSDANAMFKSSEELLFESKDGEVQLVKKGDEFILCVSGDYKECSKLQEQQYYLNEIKRYYLEIREELSDEQIAAMEKMFVQASEVTDYNESLLNQLIALRVLLDGIRLAPKEALIGTIGHLAVLALIGAAGWKLKGRVFTKNPHGFLSLMVALSPSALYAGGVMVKDFIHSEKRNLVVNRLDNYIAFIRNEREFHKKMDEIMNSTKTTLKTKTKYQTP